MEFLFQRIDVGFGSIGAFQCLQFGVDVLVQRWVDENALSSLELRLEALPGILDSLAANAGDDPFC
jgi:hypothetical protein